MVHYWLRHEVKPGEERVILTPADVEKLIKEGVQVTVERSPTRCHPDEEYEKIGATMVKSETWFTDAPKDAIIIGLKELPDNDDDMERNHIFFAHCYKNQGGWDQVLSKFARGKGLLWDLEFLVHENGRRVAAFGRAAGIVGMAVALLTWCGQRLGKPIGALSSWKSTQLLIDDIKAQIKLVQEKEKSDVVPTALVIGHLGRCGGGACWIAESCGVTPIKWDMAETKGGGPFDELLEVDVLVNCIYLTSKIPHFLTKDMIERPKRTLSVFSDVSCDTSNPNNPFPIYNEGTTLTKPLLNVLPAKEGEPPLDVIAIDHLPSLIPCDSSVEFSGAILPHMLDLAKDGKESPVWARAEKLYHEKVQMLKDSGSKYASNL